MNHDMQETFRETTVFYSLGNNLFVYFNQLGNVPSNINNIHSLDLSNVRHRTKEFYVKLLTSHVGSCPAHVI